MSAKRLNLLAGINAARSYLEVGVKKGWTFERVEVPYKVGVDPEFRFDVREKPGIFHAVTSDLFFAELAQRHGAFDLIYLDGLHTFEQTYRDFCASLQCSHATTIWLLDDTQPRDELSSLPDHKLVQETRERLGSKDVHWHGDVYKVVFAIHDLWPQYSYATTTPPGRGQTVVWREARRNPMPTWGSLEAIDRLGYADFLRYGESHMNFTDQESIFQAIGAGIGKPAAAPRA